MATRARVKRRPKIFYGWYILGVAMLGAFLSAGTSQVFMGVMLKPMTADLGWSRTATSGAITAGTLTAGLLAPLFGRLADRYGPRLLMPLGALAVVGAYFALASLSQLWQFYLAYVVGRSIGQVTLAGVVPMTAATNWFHRMRGRALGLIAMALPLGGSMLAFTGQLIIESQGWRTVFAVFGVMMLALLVVPLALVMRGRPEEMGLLPDGDAGLPVTATPASPGTPKEEGNWTLREAMRTPALWLLIAGLSIGITANGALGFHQVAYYTDIGIAATAAAAALSVYAFSGAVANGLWGFLVERVSARYLTVLDMLVSGAAILYLLSVNSTAGAMLFAVTFGLAARGESALVMIILAQYYGRRSYGAISGFVTQFQMAGLGLGPLVASISFDLTDSYRGIFMLFAACFFLAAVLVWLARRPVLSGRTRLSAPLA